jgi:hypothetical protein
MKGFIGYEFDAVIAARKEVRERFRKDSEALESTVRLEHKQRMDNGILQPLRPWISLR